MPPPPPPSKSYLLVLDSDSSDESEDEYCRRHHFELTQEKLKTIEPSRVFGVGESDHAEICKSTSESGGKNILDTDSMQRTPLILQPSPSQREDHNSSKLVNDLFQQNHESKKLTKNQKKRRQRRKKKKALQRQRSEEVGNIEGNRVTFSDVSVREFPRAFSEVSVPAHGGWPLGMELEGYEDCDRTSIEDYENRKQIRLRDRWSGILDKRATGSPSKPSSPSKKKKGEKEIDEQTIQLVNIGAAVNNSARGDGDSARENTIYESRQWDYRSRLKNPLFGQVSEDERRAIFLESSSIHSDEKEVRKNNISAGNGRARSNSFCNRNYSNSRARSRSNSLGNHDLGNSMKGKFNEVYNQAMVHHVRNELEQLRFERNKSGATGCNCRKLVVYLPPKDGSGGKKAQHRRLKPSKVVQELKKRNLYDKSVASMTREQMEKVLHKAVANEPCCRDDSCFCVRNGIICQADACSCWHGSHGHAKQNSGSNNHILSNDDIRKRCGNPLGTYSVDSEAIDTYRTKKLKQMKLLQGESSDEDTKYVCQFIETPS